MLKICDYLKLLWKHYLISTLSKINPQVKWKHTFRKLNVISLDKSYTYPTLRKFFRIISPPLIHPFPFILPTCGEFVDIFASWYKTHRPKLCFIFLFHFRKDDFSAVQPLHAWNNKRKTLVTAEGKPYTSSVPLL